MFMGWKETGILKSMLRCMVRSHRAPLYSVTEQEAQQ